MSDGTARSADRIAVRDDLLGQGDAASVIGEYAAADIVASSKRRDRVIAVKRYDFRRPDKFSRDELRTLSVIHETLARANTATLSALCRSACTLRVSAVDQLNFGEYLALLPPSAVLGSASLSPLPGSFAFAMDGAAASAIIELLGGATEPTPGAMDRDVTDLERDALGAVFARLAEDLREAWKPILDAEGRFEGLQRSGSRDTRIVSDHEMIVLVTFECAIGAVRGELSFALPFLLLEPIIPKLTARWFYAPRTAAGGPRSRTALSRIPLASTLYYETGELSLARLAALKVGDLLPLVEHGDGDLLLEVGGRPLLRMRRAKSKGEGSYVVTSTSVRGSTLADLPGNADEGRTAEGYGADSPAAAFSRVAAGLEASLSRMERKLEEFGVRQDELSDQAFFGGSGPDRGDEDERARPLAFAEGLDRRRFAEFLAGEHPQTAALVLSCLDSAPAGDLLSRLPVPLQGEVARRIARIGPASPLLLAEIESTLRHRGELTAGERGVLGGLDHLAEMQKSAGATTAAAIAEILGARA